MTNKILTTLLFITISCSLKAQSLSRVTSGVDVGLGYGYDNKQWAPSGTYHQELSLKHFPWFNVGWGVRTWGFYTGRTDLFPKSSVAAAAGDTMKYGNISTTGVSFLFGLNVKLWRFDIGANTDLISVVFGPNRKGLYDAASISGAGSEYVQQHVNSTPNLFNTVPLLVDNQNGQSELYVRYWVTNRIGVKAAYVYGSVAYKTTVSLNGGQNLYSTTYGIPYLAVSFPLYN